MYIIIIIIILQQETSWTRRLILFRTWYQFIRINLLLAHYVFYMIILKG